MKRVFLFLIIVGLGTASLYAAPDEKGRPDLGVNASLHGWRPFPDNNAWNTPIDHLPVDANSAKYVASIGVDKLISSRLGQQSQLGHSLYSGFWRAAARACEI